MYVCSMNIKSAYQNTETLKDPSITDLHFAKKKNSKKFRFCMCEISAKFDQTFKLE